MPRHSAYRRSLVALTFALVALSPWTGVRPASADISGNTYTSPLYDYTVTWDESWFVVEEVSDGYDLLNLTNGLTYATFIAGPDTAMTLESALATTVGFMRADPAVGDITPVLDDSGDAVRGAGGDYAFAAFSFPLTMPDGSVVDLTGYLEARLLIPGGASLGFLAYMPTDRFDTERPRIEGLVAGLRLPGEEPVPELAPRAAEALPIFASDRWRIAVVTSALAGDFPEAGLERRPDKEWLVVVLDVTNWSDVTNWNLDDAPLPLREFSLTVDGVEKPFKTALKSTRSVAAELGTVAPSDELVLRITSAETSRVTLVFQVPERGRLLVLHHGETAFPLADSLSAELSSSTFPLPTEAPLIEQGTIVSASDGRTMRVQLDGETESRRVRLLGVTPPEKGACFEHSAEVLLDDLTGSTVLLETEPAIGDDESAERYVWLVGDDGRRTLLNHRLIADGLAMADDMPGEAVVEIWMSAAERAAKEREAGLWASCTSA